MDDVAGDSADKGANSTFHQQLRNSEYRRKFIYSVILFYSQACLGIRRGQHAPAFLDLAQITGANVEQASVFYTAESVGTLIGTFSMGFLFDKLPGHRPFLLAATCILGAASTTAIPWNNTYISTVFLFFINAFLDGGCDAGASANLLSKWGVNWKVFMQILHFSYSMGAIISPFTVQPFLSHVESNHSTSCQQLLNNHVNSSDHYQSGIDTTVNTTVNINNNQKECELSESRIYFAYLIAGVLCLSSGISLAVEGCIASDPSKIHAQNAEQHRIQHKLPTWVRMIMLTLIAMIFSFHSSSMYTTAGYIMAFSVNGLGWSKTKAAQLSSVFWGGFASSRLIGVLLIKWLSPSKIILFCTSTVVFGFLAVWFAVTLDCGWGVFAGVFLSALGSGAIFPTGLVYLETCVIKVTGRVISVIWIAGSVQGMLTPPLQGYLMQKVSFMWYIYLVIIQGTLCFLAFVILMKVVTTRVSKCNSLKKQTVTDEENEVEICLEESN